MKLLFLWHFYFKIFLDNLTLLNLFSHAISMVYVEYMVSPKVVINEFTLEMLYFLLEDQ